MDIRNYYQIVEKPTASYFAIKLTEATPWSGFIYSYGKVNFSGKPNPDGTSTVKFEYDIEVLGPVDDQTINSPEFNKLLGDILVDIIKDGFVDYEKEK